MYLTFDDGPCPESTPQILDVLRKHGVKATFFCVGNNVRKHYHLFERILQEGHGVGNHAMNHEDAFGLSTGRLMDSVTEAAVHLQSDLFRPPHGHLYPWQVAALRRKGYRIVMYDVICYDWERERSAGAVAESVKRWARNGSVIVLHDSVKAAPRVLPVLDEVVGWLKERFEIQSLESRI